MNYFHQVMYESAMCSVSHDGKPASRVQHKHEMNICWILQQPMVICSDTTTPIYQNS